MKLDITRRQLLGLGVGGAQLALLNKFGFLEGKAHAAPRAGAPSRVVTIYLSGGYAPQYMWGGITPEEVATNIPPVQGAGVAESAFYTAEDLIEVGAGGGGFAPLQVARSWDPNDPGSRLTANGRKYLPLGYSWQEHDLWNQTTVVHGIDQGTAAHASAYVSAMCGVAGGEYRAPAVQSVIANALYASTKDFRPLPCVALDSRGMPVPLDLPSRAAPIYVPGLDALRESLSDSEMTSWWQGLNARTEVEAKNWAGEIDGNARRTLLEEAVLNATRSMSGKSQSAATEKHLKALYDGFGDVSKVLARNVVDVLTNTLGVEYMTENPSFGGKQPYGMGPWGYTYGLADENVTSPAFQNVFDMALRLMKADLTSSIHLYMPNFYYDTHSGQPGHQRNYLNTRGGHDVIARFLGEMKQTMVGGKSLLDDTLVVIFSEFSRTWARGSGENFNYTDDHWPYTSVTFVGGGVAGGRAIGGYDVSGGGGPIGKNVDLKEEGGEMTNRPPRSADIAATICSIMGLELNEFFIPGGYGEILGVRA